jgi:hypothetical protein
MYIVCLSFYLCVMLPACVCAFYLILYLREKWCRPWWSTVFTAAKTSNATVEANNALLKVAYNIKADSVVNLIRSTHQRSIDDQGKSLIAMDNSAYQVSIDKGLIFLICQQSYVTFSCSVQLFVTVVLCTVAQLLFVAPGSVEHQFAECRTKYRAHVAACFERAVGRTFHYSILAASAASVTVVKVGLGVALENGRNLFVVNLSPSTNL